LVGDMQLHASSIQRDGYMDDFVCFTNTVLTKYKKYAFSGNRPDFRVWFTDMNGDPVTDMNTREAGLRPEGANTEGVNFVLELMPEY